jgi:hypothetical protein
MFVVLNLSLLFCHFQILRQHMRISNETGYYTINFADTRAKEQILLVASILLVLQGKCTITNPLFYGEFQIQCWLMLHLHLSFHHKSVSLFKILSSIEFNQWGL